MTLKRYQVAILSFAFGIFVVTFVLGYLLKSKNESIIISPTPRVDSVVTVKAFFSNIKEDPQTLYCDRTYPVDRQVTLISDVAKSRLGETAYLAVNEVLKGSTDQEKVNGFFTSINEGVQVKTIKIENEVATIDFNYRLGDRVAGSCNVQAIRSQITETLMQFTEIKSVIISVDGESEGVLQP